MIIKNSTIRKSTTKQSTFRQSKSSRLPLLFIAGVLSTGLLLSGCSDNDVADVETESADTPAVVTTSESDANQDDNQAADVNATTEQIGDDAKDNVKDETTIDNANINPVTAPVKQKSLVTNPTKTGTPEDTVKQALNSLYYGDVKQAATYYKVDMANFEEELAKT